MKRLSMRKITEVLRLKWSCNRSNRVIANSICVSTSTVSDCVRRAKRAGLSWPLAGNLDDEQLEQMLYGPKRSGSSDVARGIDYTHIHLELKRKGVTLQLLWDEYQENHPEGISYSQYCNLYRAWSKDADVYMRQPYKAGEKLFIDYAGMTVPIILDINSGAVHEAQIFVAAFGASNYTYAEATLTQKLPDWIASHVRAFEYFGGVPEMVIPDNLKTGVNKAHLYEPDVNQTYQDMANHYDVTVVPTRIASPKDKAKVEEAVQNVERRILAKLRNRTFFSLHELNEAIKPLLSELNNRQFQKLPGSRLSQFETLEKPALRPLPQTDYVYAEWVNQRLGRDYHFGLDDHRYSAPYTLSGKKLEIRYTRTIVEAYYHGRRIASHMRSYQKGKHTTLIEHMPKSHQEHAKWTPPVIIKAMEDNGEASGLLANKIISERKQQGFRSCLGIIRLTKSYGKTRLEAACKRALAIGSHSYKSVQSILKNNLDQQPMSIFCQEQKHVTECAHENVRGGDYFK
jgi:transposase